ncbi:hypothetical protein CARUB_v10007953mg [Capsella rubella]|uniref:MULE transposase domain-containing protein n=1 Tax=Capsella rubella TaxID=81985 RepID=R0GM73_9BRAS|nr:hypothetical protein CARUB_v10007953mg [Capsella rubella]
MVPSVSLLAGQLQRRLDTQRNMMKELPIMFRLLWSNNLPILLFANAHYEGDEIFVGRLFKDKEDCTTKLAIHAIRHKFHFISARSTPEYVAVVCLHDSERFEIRTALLQHTCSVDARDDFHKMASTAVIGKLMRTKYVGVGRGSRPNELRKILRQEFSLNVSYWKAWQAREISMDNAMGSAIGSYALIQPFKYLFFAMFASIKGFAFMRKVIVIDGTHLRGRFGGGLIAASAQDANFQVFPIAFDIVNSENDDAWTWFMEKLSDAVSNDPDLVIVSDRHSSIYASIRMVFPMASHAACVVHLKRNILAIFKSEHLSCLVSSAARAYRLAYFNKLFSKARDYPVISILDTIRSTLVTWFALRREAARLEENILPPKVNEMVIDNYEKGSRYLVMKIAVVIRERIRVDTLVGDPHTVPNLRFAYAEMIMLVPDMGNLAPSPSDAGGGRLAPPFVRRPPGRPRRRRIFSRGEFTVITIYLNRMLTRFLGGYLQLGGDAATTKHIVLKKNPVAARETMLITAGSSPSSSHDKSSAGSSSASGQIIRSTSI